MPESDLSAEVNATTVLPAPSTPSTTVSTGTADISLSWATNDNSSDGGIDVERSTDGFSTTTTIASGLAPSTTSYSDTSTSAGTTYEYRIERTTDHTEATSGTVSQRAPLTLTRSVALTASGNLAATRAVTLFRRAAITGGGRMALTRSTDKPRTVAVVGSDGSVAVVRDALAKSRAAAIVGRAKLDANGQFSEPFPSETTRDLDWDYNFNRRGFESEWSYQVGSDGAGSVALYIEGRIGDLDPATPTATIDYDASGDGGVDERSLSRSVPATGHPVVFPELSGGDGYYRVLLQDLRPDDILVAVTVGPTHT